MTGHYWPEANYGLALVFILDMERISKMGTDAERNAMLYAYPDKVYGYLSRYVDGTPSGRYAARAKALLLSRKKD